jgi:hypothetical protein
VIRNPKFRHSPVKTIQSVTWVPNLEQDFVFFLFFLTWDLKHGLECCTLKTTYCRTRASTKQRIMTQMQFVILSRWYHSVILSLSSSSCVEAVKLAFLISLSSSLSLSLSLSRPARVSRRVKRVMGWEYIMGIGARSYCRQQSHSCNGVTVCQSRACFADSVFLGSGPG